MITDEKLARINELARKAKAEGLTSAETKERDVLRREYIEAVRANLRGQLNNINIQELDGSIRKQVFAQRAKTSEAFVQQQSSLIAGKIFALPQFQDASCIYVYMDYNKEASTRPIIEEAWRLGKKSGSTKSFR